MHKCAVLSGSQKSFECSPCSESFECESKLEKHNKRNHSVDGINFRLNKTQNGVPPTKKIKEGHLLDVAPTSTSSQEPMDQDTIVVAAMKAAIDAEMITESLEVPKNELRLDDLIKKNYDPSRSVADYAGIIKIKSIPASFVTELDLEMAIQTYVSIIEIPLNW